MLQSVIDKLGCFVDLLTDKWRQLTTGKRGEDDFSGFLWIIGMIVLIVDIFVQSVPWLIIGLAIVIYAFFRCFSTFGYHDTEVAVFHGIGNGIKSVAVKMGLKVSSKVKDFQESDKKAMVEQLKDKVVPDEQTKLERAEQKAMKDAYYIFDCPGCKQKVRIPNRGKKGRVAIVCPACKTRFVRMRW